MFHTNARKPNCSVCKSILCKVSSNGSTLLSSTTVRIAEHILGQAWLPKCGSPVFEPRPCTFSRYVARSYFSTSFKKYMGCMPSDYVKKQRK